MRKSLVLLELIISILILSVVIIYALLFITDLYKINAQTLLSLNTKIDLQTTALFIQNRLHSSVKIKTDKNKISFYEIDTKSFNSGYYSGLALLEKSSKESVFTPNSLISRINPKYIWFDKNTIYEIEKSFEDNKIYFKNKNIEKKIYTQYKLLKQKSYIYLKKTTLFFNNHILMKNIKKFEVKQIDTNILLTICENYCQEVVISL